MMIQAKKMTVIGIRDLIQTPLSQYDLLYSISSVRLSMDELVRLTQTSKEDIVIDDLTLDEVKEMLLVLEKVNPGIKRALSLRMLTNDEPC